MDFDTVILNGLVVTPEGEKELEIGIANEKIQALEPQLSGSANREINAKGCLILPGFVDAHVHINEPGNTDWEGFTTGSAAAAAGGVTCFFDMPLNSIPTTVSVDAFQKKVECAKNSSVIDFAIWGGLVADNLDQLEGLYEAGVIGFKGFMAESGLPEFPWVDPPMLKKGMERIAQLPGMRLALHAEDNKLISAKTTKFLDQGRIRLQDFVNSRPIIAELTAIKLALELSGETGCPIHIVHVSCPEGIDLIEKAKLNTVDVTVETCPHYLLLSTEDFAASGAIAKCTPPLRSSATRTGLWKKLRHNAIDTIGSDHSPCPLSMKKAENIFQAWGGISSLQHAGIMALSEGVREHNLSLAKMAKLLSGNPARIFGIGREKGSIVLGNDADLCMGEFQNELPICREDLLYKNPHSPYVGLRQAFVVKKTFVRGHCVYKKGVVSRPFKGKLLRPVR